MRINKLLSNKGICSRKQTNVWIESGRIRVNGKLAICGQWVEEEDEILLDGKPIEQQQKVYILLNKPVGITCTADQNVKNNIIDYMDYPQFIFPVGRLDKASQGLILMTNDGDLASQIIDAKYEHEKEYIVTVHKAFDETFLEKMGQGVWIGQDMTKPCELTALTEDTFKIVLTQGLNRQIRRMCLAFGYKVTRLERVRILCLKKEKLEEGKWRYLTDEEVMQLKEMTQ